MSKSTVQEPILGFVQKSLIVALNLGYLLLSPFIGKAKVMAKAKWDALKRLKKVIAKRRLVQKSRRVSVIHIAKLLNWNVFAPLIKRKF